MKVIAKIYVKEIMFGFFCYMSAFLQVIWVCDINDQI